MRVVRTAPAWDLIGFEPEPNQWLRIVGGRALYEAAIFYDETRGDRVKLARLDVTPEGIRQVNRYVEPDARVEVVEK